MLWTHQSKPNQNSSNWKYWKVYWNLHYKTFSPFFRKKHEHVTCKYKFIMGSAQSKLSSTQHSNKVNTHLKCMKHRYNAHVMQCMKFKDHFNKNPSQNFNKNSKVLKNLKQFQNPQKLGQRSWKCMIKMKKVSYQMRNKDLETEKEVRKMKSLSFGWLREGEKSVYREGSRRIETEIARILFIGK